MYRNLLNTDKMRTFLFLPLFFFFILGCKSIERRMATHDSDLYIGIHDCFENDTLKVLINDQEIINITNLTSNSLGVTDIYIQYYSTGKNKGIIVIYNSNKSETRKEIYLDLKKEIMLEVIRNNNSDKFLIDIKKGKKIVVSGCSEDRKTTSIIYFKKKIIVE